MAAFSSTPKWRPSVPQGASGSVSGRVVATPVPLAVSGIDVTLPPRSIRPAGRPGSGGSDPADADRGAPRASCYGSLPRPATCLQRHGPTVVRTVMSSTQVPVLRSDRCLCDVPPGYRHRTGYPGRGRGTVDRARRENRSRRRNTRGAASLPSREDGRDHARHPPREEERPVSESENPVISAPEPEPHRPRSNQDWWPDQLDLSVLRQHEPRVEPAGRRLRLRRRVRRGSTSTR